MLSHSHRLVRHLLLIGAVVGLSACTTMGQTPPGAPLDQVIQEYGAPNFECIKADGTPRVIWTMQPAGQYAWGSDILPDGRTEKVTAILTDDYFKRLDSGTWTADQVRCEFGPPADISGVGLPSVREIVWAYRYKQYGVWNSLMYVYMGRNGDQMTRHHPGPDPLYDEDRFLR